MLKDFNWSVQTSLYGCDHFPIIVTPLYQEQNIETRSGWATHRADWSKFTKEMDTERKIEEYISIPEAANFFSSLIKKAADISMPKLNIKKYKYNVPWWSKDCAIAISQKKQAYNRWKRTKCLEDLIRFKRLRAISKRVLLEAKRSSWRTYVGSFNENTPLKRVWANIRKIMGKKSSNPSIVLKEQDVMILDQSKIANILATTFAKASSPQHYSIPFLKHKTIEEAKPLNWKKSNTIEKYNMDFTITEMMLALQSCKDTAPGPDNVTYVMLRHLPDTSFNFLLSLYNAIWTSHIMPNNWGHAQILPFPKPNKDPTLPTNYRPIALTSCISKLMEKMVAARLSHILETKNYFSEYQFGFRKGRSTIDALQYLTTNIQESFSNNSHVLAVFIDVEKAYDTTWRRGILNILMRIGIQGHLLQFIKNFLSNRTFQVQLVAINTIATDIPNGIKFVLYADDLVIFSTAKNHHTAERYIQLALNKLSEWCKISGFSFSPTKTKVVHFCRTRSCHYNPLVYINNQQIENVMSIKYLGLTLDHRLTWIEHIKFLRSTCEQAMNILKCLSHLSWGADRNTLIRLYKSLIISKINYGCQVYASANENVLARLDPLHHKAIRLCTGAFRSSPSISLCADSGIPPLEFLRGIMQFRYYLRLQKSHCEFAKEILNIPEAKFYDKPTLSQPFGVRIKTMITHLPQPINILKETPYQMPPWKLPHIKCCRELLHLNKHTMPESQLRTEFINHSQKHYAAIAIYTDGSKTNEHVAAAATSGNVFSVSRLMTFASIYTAELVAIIKALRYINLQNSTSFVIYSDSRSALEAITKNIPNHPLICEIQRWIVLLNSNNKAISLCWVPAHVRIEGNERADQLAREATNLHISNRAIPASDYIPIIKSTIYSQWQHKWEETPQSNKLRQIKETVKR
ncbi:unnamed protein product, partial [Rotaria magnacalcarata]